jgi:uncharacterized membrane protein YccF (DUF307 family)
MVGLGLDNTCSIVSIPHDVICSQLSNYMMFPCIRNVIKKEQIIDLFLDLKPET